MSQCARCGASPADVLIEFLDDDGEVEDEDYFCEACPSMLIRDEITRHGKSQITIAE